MEKQLVEALSDIGIHDLIRFQSILNKLWDTGASEKEILVYLTEALDIATGEVDRRYDLYSLTNEANHG
jgi:hypothetical protein